jgi:hypothetical protein
MIFVLWTGENQMGANRLKGLDSIIANNSSVTLVTRNNLKDWICEPLHPGYEFLSDVHKSDYLRCYLMHFYGGGYMDVKCCERSWSATFAAFESSNMWACGYREVAPYHVAQCDNAAQRRLLEINYKRLIGMCAFIFKPNTPMTEEWYSKVWQKMDAKYDLLKATPGNVRGDNPGYPLRWTELLGDILHPLCLKYSQKIIQDDRIKPNFNKAYM